MKRSAIVLLLSMLATVVLARTGDTLAMDSCRISIPGSAYRNPENAYWENKLPVFFKCPIKDVEVSIYDRWGKPLLDAAPLIESSYIHWDYSNIQEGTYFWVIKCKLMEEGNEVEKSFTGSITIVI